MPQPILSQCRATAVAAAGPLLQRAVEQAIESLQQAETASGKTAERRELADAWLELRKVRDGWVRQFPSNIEREWHAVTTRQPAAAAAATEPARGRSKVVLSLVQDEEVALEIESSRLKQVLAPTVEQSQSELDALMSSALGLATVEPERNPLQPDVVTRSLQPLLDEATLPGMASLWVRHLAPPLARELDALYRGLVQQLKTAKVQAAGYRVLPLAGSSRPGAAAGTAAPAAPAAPGGTGPAATGDAAAGGPGGRDAGGGTAGPSTSGAGPAGSAKGQATASPGGGQAAAAGAGRGASAAAPLVWEEIERADLSHPVMQEFIYQGGAHAQAPLEPSYYERVQAEVAHLESAPIGAHEVYDPQSAARFLHLPSVDRPVRHVGTETPLDENLWGRFAAPRERSLLHARLKQQAERVGQALGLELVRKLVNQVAQDGRLLAPVREAIVALEPSLLRLAVADPRYFAEEQHPARRLIEGVADRSFRFNDEASPEFRGFESQIAVAFNRLNRQDIVDAAPFGTALENLEAAWAVQDEEEKAQRDAAGETMRFAEERQVAADQIAWDLSQRSDLDGAPAVVQDFLFGPWALVMAQARLRTPNHPDPGSHGSVVTDLLWSVKHDETLRQPARLFEIVPGLLSRLRAGLAELGQDAAESASFFHSLERLHRPVLRLRARHRRDAVASQPAELEPLPDEPALAPAPAQKPQSKESPWLGRRELDAAGYEDTLPAERADLIELHEQAALLAEGQRAASLAEQPAANGNGSLPSQEAEYLVAALREGSWVDLFSRNQWLRARLIWAAAKGTLFMFHSHGGQPHSMTRRTCLRLVRERLLRPVETHGVVEHALQAVVREPDRELMVA